MRNIVNNFFLNPSAGSVVLILAKCIQPYWVHSLTNNSRVRREMIDVCLVHYSIVWAHGITELATRRQQIFAFDCCIYAGWKCVLAVYRRPLTIRGSECIKTGAERQQQESGNNNTWSSRRNFYFDYLFVFFFSIPVAQMMRAGSPSHAMYPDDPHHPIQMSHQPVNERWNTTAVLSWTFVVTQ